MANHAEIRLQQMLLIKSRICGPNSCLEPMLSVGCTWLATFEEDAALAVPPALLSLTRRTGLVR